MSAMFKSAAPGFFVPDALGESSMPSSGKRRTFDRVEALPLKWPTAMKERYDLFDAWHDVAMQILHREKGSFRLIATTKKVILWSQGVITDSNAVLATRAGYCSEKTIKREVREYADLGIITAEMGWRRLGSQIIRTRTLRLALPIDLQDGIVLPDTAPFDRDNSGPDGWATDRDHCGPSDRDNSGPITIDHKKGGSDAA